MTHAEIILAISPYIIGLITIASVAVAINTVIENWLMRRLMQRRVSELFPG